LSHAHFDHVDHIQFLDPLIPVYLGEGTKFFLEAMEETSGFCDYKEHEYQTFRTGKKVKVGNLEVEPIHVDHSIPAAYGFLIHTSEGTVVYTGDLRLHGPRKEMTEEFIQKAKNCEPVAMICEGTRVVDKEKRKNYSEEKVRTSSEKVVTSTDKIIFLTQYSRDMDRFRSFYTIATKNDRKIVISPKKAFLLNRLMQDDRLQLPDPLKDPDILVYYKKKKSGKYEERDYYKWEREFMDKMVTTDFVRKNQDKLIMDLGFYQFAELIDIRPEKGSHFIHSMSEPFSEEDVEDEIMHNWMEHFGMQFHQLHASGHMNKQQIIDSVNYINPKACFPIHTENQQLFKESGRNVRLTESQKTYEVS